MQLCSNGAIISKEGAHAYMHGSDAAGQTCRGKEKAGDLYLNIAGVDYAFMAPRAAQLLRHAMRESISWKTYYAVSMTV